MAGTSDVATSCQVQIVYNQSVSGLHGGQSAISSHRSRVKGCCGDDVFIWLQSSGRDACMVVQPAGKVGYPGVY